MKVARERMSLTQEELGARAGVDQGTISLIERASGKRGPNADTVVGIALALGESVGDYLSLAGIVPSSESVEIPRRSPLGDVILILEADPEIGPQLAEVKRTQTPRVYREAVEALAEAWRSNAKLMLRTFKAGQESSGR